MKVVGILLLLAALALLGVFAWPLLHPESVKGKPPETSFQGARSQAVPASSANTGEPAAEPPSPPSHAEPAATAAGPLCDRAFDSATARQVSLPQGEVMRRGPAAREHSWTWVSLWAAWCKPCKAEMPILADWATRLRARGAAIRPVFLSLDDDERQLRRYLSAEGAGIVGDILWAKDDAARTRFFGAIGVENPPTLPVQAILDPAGRLRCVRVGSISERELDEATRTFKW